MVSLPGGGAVSVAEQCEVVAVAVGKLWYACVSQVSEEGDGGAGEKSVCSDAENMEEEKRKCDLWTQSNYGADERNVRGCFMFTHLVSAAQISRTISYISRHSISLMLLKESNAQ